MNTLEQLLHHATTLLMAPVVTTLAVLLVWTLLATGGFGRELLDRRRAAGPIGLVARFHGELQRVGGGAARHEELVDRCEAEGDRRVSRLNLVARAGPTLGLMATLIPMGPALLALAEDDVAQLARSLAIAFTATVVGLLVGLLCAVMGSVRRHWYAADLLELDAWRARAAGEGA